MSRVECHRNIDMGFAALLSIDRLWLKITVVNLSEAIQRQVYLNGYNDKEKGGHHFENDGHIITILPSEFSLPSPLVQSLRRPPYQGFEQRRSAHRC
jgi:hypothetical protein